MLICILAIDSSYYQRPLVLHSNCILLGLSSVNENFLHNMSSTLSSTYVDCFATLLDKNMKWWNDIIVRLLLLCYLSQSQDSVVLSQPGGNIRLVEQHLTKWWNIAMWGFFIKFMPFEYKHLRSATTLLYFDMLVTNFCSWKKRINHKGWGAYTTVIGGDLFLYVYTYLLHGTHAAHAIFGVSYKIYA